MYRVPKYSTIKTLFKDNYAKQKIPRKYFFCGYTGGKGDLVLL